jgi:hypothetical protein
LEGNFNSLFAGRAGDGLKDSVRRASGYPFAPVSVQPTSQIVVSDANIVTNPVTAGGGPQSMGQLPFDNYRFANRDFLLNALDYLVSERKLYESRNKDFVLRLLDKKRVEEERVFWQLINLLGPILILIIAALLLTRYRQHKFSATNNQSST